MVLSGATDTVQASPVELECTSQTSNYKLALIVDLNRKAIWRQGFAGIKLVGWEIVEQTPNLITARSFVERTGSPRHGGDVIVIDRQSGRFVYTSIGLVCDQNECASEPLNVQSIVGTCTKKVL